MLRPGAKHAILLLCLMFLALTVWKGVVQDYYHYLQMWREVRQGHDPWFLVYGVFGAYPLNAYGPVFNLLAIPAWLNPLFPKLLFAYAYLIFAILMFTSAINVDPGSRLRSLGLMVWFWNPFAWVEISYFGHFDVLVGLLCLGAVETRVRHQDVRSGIYLAVGVLLKYMPIVLLPFLILDRKRIRVRLLVVALGLIALGLGTSVAIWGASTFRPLGFAAGRSSHYLSIYRFLKGRHSPMFWFDFYEDPDQFAMPALAIALGSLWAWTRRKSVPLRAAAALSILITLLFYQVGFPQYQMVLFVLASNWVIRDQGKLRWVTVPWVALGLYWSWLAVFDLIDASVEIDKLWMQEWVGLPTFLLGLLLAICIGRSCRIPGETAPSGLSDGPIEKAGEKG